MSTNTISEELKGAVARIEIAADKLYGSSANYFPNRNPVNVMLDLIDAISTLKRECGVRTPDELTTAVNTYYHGDHKSTILNVQTRCLYKLEGLDKGWVQGYLARGLTIKAMRAYAWKCQNAQEFKSLLEGTWNDIYRGGEVGSASEIERVLEKFLSDKSDQKAVKVETRDLIYKLNQIYVGIEVPHSSLKTINLHLDLVEVLSDLYTLYKQERGALGETDLFSMKMFRRWLVGEYNKHRGYDWCHESRIVKHSRIVLFKFLGLDKSRITPYIQDGLRITKFKYYLSKAVDSDRLYRLLDNTWEVAKDTHVSEMSDLLDRGSRVKLHPPTPVEKPQGGYVNHPQAQAVIGEPAPEVVEEVGQSSGTDNTEAGEDESCQENPLTLTVPVGDNPYYNNKITPYPDTLLKVLVEEVKYMSSKLGSLESAFAALEQTVIRLETAINNALDEVVADLPENAQESLNQGDGLPGDELTHYLNTPRPEVGNTLGRFISKIFGKQ